MTAGRMLALETRVCRLLGKRPGESLIECARRVLAAPKTAKRTRMAAHVLLGEDPPWQAMLRADWWLS